MYNYHYFREELEHDLLQFFHKTYAPFMDDFRVEMECKKFYNEVDSLLEWLAVCYLAVWSAKRGRGRGQSLDYYERVLRRARKIVEGVSERNHEYCDDDINAIIGMRNALARDDRDKWDAVSSEYNYTLSEFTKDQALRRLLNATERNRRMAA